jgi:hypothetical protein
MSELREMTGDNHYRLLKAISSDKELYTKKIIRKCRAITYDRVY